MRRFMSLGVFLLAALLACAPALPARAASEAAFTQADFAAAQAAGTPVLIEIDASWCPTCAKQRPILSRLQADPAFRSLTIYKVDFDSQKDVVRAMGAQVQSTLIVFRGKMELGRSVGDTDAGSIRALLLRAVAPAS